MPKKGHWFHALKKKWSKRKKKQSDPILDLISESGTTGLIIQPVLPSVIEPATTLGGAENEQTKHAYNIALATAKAAEAAAAAAQAAAEVVRLTTSANHLDGKSKHELAAIRIQTAFRGLMARKRLRALRGLRRLKVMMQGQPVKRQTLNTLKSMQTLTSVQSQIHDRRLKMTEEKQNIQRQIQQKRAKEQAKDLEKSQVKKVDGWDSSVKTKEQIEAKLHNRHEAAIKRERTLAYALTHQQNWRATSTSLFMDPNTPHWGWSWLERWLAVKPCEAAIISDKESTTNNSSRFKAPKITTSSPKTQVTNSYTRFHNAEKSSPKSVAKQPHSPAAPRLSTSSTPSKKICPGVVARKLRSPSPKASQKTSKINDDAKSMVSEQSARNSDVESPLRDNESLTSSQTAPSYMAPTESAKAKSRLGDEFKGHHSSSSRSVTPDRLSVSSTKKRASSSPARSRRSTTSIPDADSLTVTEHT